MIRDKRDLHLLIDSSTAKVIDLLGGLYNRKCQYILWAASGIPGQPLAKIQSLILIKSIMEQNSIVGFKKRKKIIQIVIKVKKAVKYFKGLKKGELKNE